MIKLGTIVNRIVSRVQPKPTPPYQLELWLEGGGMRSRRRREVTKHAVADAIAETS